MKAENFLDQGEGARGRPGGLRRRSAGCAAASFGPGQTAPEACSSLTVRRWRGIMYKKYKRYNIHKMNRV